MSWKLGVDIGGTFIDFCALDTEKNRLVTLKVLTTPDDPGRELSTGLDLLAEREGVALEAIHTFVHGTTIGINTIIQRKGARLALITNAGFEDVIELARLRMPEMYSLFCAQPEALISRDRIHGIAGRILADGSEDAPLDPAQIEGVAAAIGAQKVDGVVVSLLHSYVERMHERAVKEMLRDLLPDAFVFTSSEVWPVIREYERATTAVLNGYVHPRVAGYLEGLERTLTGKGVPAEPLLSKSNGGLMQASEGKTACVNMLLSGTAAGVTGAAWLGQQAGERNLLTLDIGGTSADVALVIDGAPQFGDGETVGEFPLHIPSVSVSSIGIGGGSIAHVDAFGVLKVGPESAGSLPGPAAYGRGGTEATVTDAMVVCGYLGHAPLAYGQLEMNRELALQAVTRTADALGRSVEEAAQAILDVAVSEIFVEIEKLASRYGVDLREFALMPFGGGGPMLGCFLARELDMDRVIAPRRPGVVSALGGLVADIKGDFIQTLMALCDSAAMPAVKAAAGNLGKQGKSWLRDGQKFEGVISTRLSADMRYAGQSFEIEVPLQDDWIETGDFEAIRAAFHARHHELYQFSDSSGAVEFVNLRLVAKGETAAVDMPSFPPVGGEAQAAREIKVFQDGRERIVPLYLRADLKAGQRLTAPAVVAQEDTTLAIPAGFYGKVDSYLNIHLSCAE